MSEHITDTAPRPQTHPSGVTVTPKSWDVTLDGRDLGLSTFLGVNYYTAHHQPTGGRRHIIDVNFPTIDDAIAAILACDRDPARCPADRAVESLRTESAVSA